MNKKYIWIISIALAILVAALITVFVIKGVIGEKENSSDLQTSFQSDDGNWTSVYEATPVE